MPPRNMIASIPSGNTPIAGTVDAGIQRVRGHRRRHPQPPTIGVPLEFLAQVLTTIPDKGQVTTRFQRFHPDRTRARGAAPRAAPYFHDPSWNSRPTRVAGVPFEQASSSAVVCLAMTQLSTLLFLVYPMNRACSRSTPSSRRSRCAWRISPRSTGRRSRLGCGDLRKKVVLVRSCS